jgi:hypothetical protein
VERLRKRQALSFATWQTADRALEQITGRRVGSEPSNFAAQMARAHRQKAADGR